MTTTSMNSSLGGVDGGELERRLGVEMCVHAALAELGGFRECADAQPIEAGPGWGAPAKEWAYLFEPYALPANQLLFDQLRVVPATRYLDVACGSGFAANIAHRRGATVSGLDASEDLIDIARARARRRLPRLATCSRSRSTRGPSMW